MSGGKCTPGKENSKCKPAAWVGACSAAWVGACSANLRGSEEAEVAQLQGRAKTYSFGLGLKGTASLLQTGAGKRERTLSEVVTEILVRGDSCLASGVAGIW